MKRIKTEPIQKRSTIQVPGSKSYTHRYLISAALSDGLCRIENPLKSEDTLLTASGLKQMGVEIDEHEDHFIIKGTGGLLSASPEEIHLGNSGTSVRLLTGICGIGEGRYVITGTERMQERPIQDLLDGLVGLGIDAKSIKGDGCPPIEINGRKVSGGSIELDCHVSSQYLSSILMMAPLSTDGIEVIVKNGPVSKPYVDMTIEVMNAFGVTVERERYEKFRIQGGQTYRAGTYSVEPDSSQAGYFWGAAAVTGASVTLRGVHFSSSQGDVRFARVLQEMGCTVSEESDGICVTGGPLKGIDIDMSDMPDMVPTLAVVAAFARGKTEIRNVAHLRAKESNRIESVANELSKMGIETHCREDGMTIHGGTPVGATISTYNDHRMAMSFAIAGLLVTGMEIEDPECVSKSFPNFWEVFETLYE